MWFQESELYRVCINIDIHIMYSPVGVMQGLGQCLRA